MKKQFFTLASLLVMGIAANAQVGIGTTSPNGSAMLDVTSTTKGLLKPRMTTLQRTAIASPATGLEVFDMTTNSTWFFNGTIWVNTASGIVDLRKIGTNNHITMDAGNGSNGTTAGTGTGNVGIGASSLANIVSGTDNQSIGVNAMNHLTTGSQNVAFGSGNLVNNETGNANVAVGFNVLANNKAHNNIGIGPNALAAAQNANYNIALGAGSMQFATGGANYGAENIAIGVGSLAHNTGNPSVANTGNNNIAIGNGSMDQNTIGQQNIAIGHGAASKNTTGTFNVGMGESILYNNTTGTYNVALGSYAGQSLTTGNFNVAVGPNAMNNGTAAGTITGISNVAVGSETLKNLVGGIRNVGVGDGAGKAITSGDNNIAVGFNNMSGSNITGSANISLGNNVLGSLSTGSNNVNIGNNAGNYTSGNQNITIGQGATVPLHNADNQLSLGNVIYGNNMGNTGSGNIGIGTYNIHAQAKLHVAADRADYGEFGQIMATGASDINKKLILGYNTTTDKGYIQSVHSGLTWTDLILQPTAGNVGIGTSTPSSLLHVNGTITATRIQGPSDSRFKKNIKPIENALEKVLALGGYTYDWKDASEFPKQTLGTGHDMGVIAQEVEKQFPEAVTTNADGFKAVSYTELVPALIEAIKAQQVQIEELKALVAKRTK